MAELTDQQWCDAIATAVSRFHAGTTNKTQLAEEMTAATEQWPTRTLSNADLAEKISKSLANLTGLVETNGPPDPDAGTIDAMAFDKVALAFYGPKTSAGWGDARPVSAGPPGPSVELQTNATHIQWRVVGDPDWIDLITLSALKGDDGREVEMRTNATHIQWRLVGDADWIDLIALDTLKGADGREVQMQRGTTHIQWRYEGEADWTDLVALADLKGDAGNNGWTAKVARVVDGERVVEQIVDWIGGTGTKPETGKFIGPTGWVDTAAEATNVRGPAGSGSGDMLAANNLSDLTDDAAARNNLDVYSKSQVDTAIGTRASQAALEALQDEVDAITVPVAGTKEDVWAGTDTGKFIPASELMAALAPQTLTLSGGNLSISGNAGINFEATVNANFTIPNMTNRKNRRTSIVSVTYSGGPFTPSLGSEFKKYAASAAIPTAANSKFDLLLTPQGADTMYSVLVK